VGIFAFRKRKEKQMKIYELKYTILGSYEKFDTSPESLGILLKIFGSEYKLITIPGQTFFPDGRTLQDFRPSFLDAKNLVKVDFLPNRIDICFNTTDIDVSLDQKEKVEISKDIFRKLTNAFPNIRVDRFAFLFSAYSERKNSTPIIDQNKFLSTNELVEWTVRTVYKKIFDFASENTRFNVVGDYIKYESPVEITLMNNKKTKKNALLFRGDINTFPEKVVDYSISEYDQFIEIGLSLAGDLIDEYTKTIC
jgi:hypothetical protein